MADPNEQAAESLNTAARKYLQAYDKSDDQARAALRAVEAALLEARRVRLKETVSPIGAFFADIGRGVVSAQRELDGESERYVRELIAKKKLVDKDAQSADVPGAAMFRIPRVSAELKLSLEKTEGGGWSVVFYSKEQQTKEMQQQSLQFEIVSVPIPAGYAQLLDRPSPSPPAAVRSRGLPEIALESMAGAMESTARLLEAEQGAFEVSQARASLPEDAPRRGAVVLESLPREAARFPLFASAALRATVREDIAKLAKQLSAVQRRRVETLLLPSWERAIVLSADEDTSFVVLAKDGKAPELLFWQVVTQPASLTELYRMPATASARRDTERVRSFFLALGRLARGERGRRT